MSSHRQRMRDHLRLRLPRARELYERRLAPLFGRGDRSEERFGRWITGGQELLRRQGTHSIRFDPDGVWVGDASGCLWLYTPGVPGSAMWVESGTPHEAEEVDALAERLPNDGVLVDVGANVGSYSVRLAHRRPDLSVIAFEPSSSAFATLIRNAEKNGVGGRIDARQTAIWSEEGTLPLTTRLQGENFVVPPGKRAAGPAVEMIPCTTLDLALASAERVDAIKCDVEGAETRVLEGAIHTLERFQPLLLIEIEERHSQRYGQQAAQVFEVLAGLGYRRVRDFGDRNFLFAPPG